MKISILVNWLILLIFSISIYACSHDKDKDGIEDAKDICPDIYAKTSDGCPEQPKLTLSKVHVFIENSASMGGYFRGNTEFNSIISDLTAKVNNEIKQIDISFISDIIIPYGRAVSDFSNDIATTNMATRKSSELHQIVRKIGEETDSSEISLLISDCILSFPDEDIRRQPEINRERAESTLKTDIYNSFDHLKKNKNFGASIYAFTSRFYGTYYDYSNNKITLNGTNRPFYVWVIGSRELLPGFDSLLESKLTYKPEKSLDFGLQNDSIASFKIITPIEKKGSGLPEGISYKRIQFSPEGILRFCAGIDLTSLPDYAKTPHYLQEHIHIDTTDCSVSFEVKNKTDVDTKNLISAPDKERFAHATHLLIITVKSMPLDKASLHITMPLETDNWYKEWSCMNDKKPDSAANKTFAFEWKSRMMAQVLILKI